MSSNKNPIHSRLFISEKYIYIFEYSFENSPYTAQVTAGLPIIFCRCLRTRAPFIHDLFVLEIYIQIFEYFSENCLYTTQVMAGLPTLSVPCT